MTNLKYKTRGNTNPKGKQRVYFCCHPNDFKTFFETVSEEILAKQNCAVWYLDADVVRDEALLADLKQMQLFVMPVTRELLCTENPALDIEFGFAVKNHIPVLPLMQERGLELLFNQKCGNLQFLDKHNTDATVISYDEKLQRYLESVLIGDELAEKIRAAFDAYVFLSYRKKDRKYAQELMRLIHKNEFCRDIAIWYDEFLTPGENFNDSIKEALQKSSLFVLTVTPNVVNEPNYIMQTEYPMAKEEGKPILLAELVPTDKALLREKYEDIPEIANAHDEAELSEVLLDAIKKIAVRENDSSPEHNFFIGLAYLGGVDVETDFDRALSLITSAAESGLVSAAGKLSDMYCNGIGVQRDYQKSAYWMGQKVELLKQNCQTEKTIENYKELVKSIEAYGEFFTKTSPEPQKAIKVYRELAEVCEEGSREFGDSEFKFPLADSYICVARNCYTLKRDKEAEDNADKAATILNAIENDTANAKTLNSLAMLYEVLSRLEQRKNGARVEEYLRKALEYSIKITQVVGSSDHNELNVAVGYLELAEHYCQKEQYQKAEECLDKCGPTATAIAKSGSLYAGEVCVRALMLKAQICKAKDNVSSAIECYATNVEQLEKSSLTPLMMRLLVENYNRLKECLFEAERYKEALLFAKKSEYAAKRVCTAGEYQLYLLHLKEFMAKCYAEIGDRNQALQIYEYLNNAYRSLYLKMPKEFVLFYMKSRFDLAEIYRKTHNYYPARREYKLLIEFCKNRQGADAVAQKATEYTLLCHKALVDVYTSTDKKIMAAIYKAKLKKLEKKQ